MATLGTLASFRVTKKYLYGLMDLKKTINGVTYEILVDPINSESKTTRTGGKSSNPKKVKYFVGISYMGGSYAIKRNVATKTDAKKILEAVKEKIDKTPKSDIKNLLIGLSRKS